MIYEDTFYKIHYPESLSEFVGESVNNALYQRQTFVKLFEFEIPRMNVAIFDERKKFVHHIALLNDKKNVVKSTGSVCYCNNELQMCVDINKQVTTLAHETCHQFFKELMNQTECYKSVWLGECLANALDGRFKMGFLTQEKLESFLKYLLPLKKFDMNILDTSSFSTKDYNAYPMFHIIGKYLNEKQLFKEYVDMYKHNPNAIEKIGKSVLNKAYNYTAKSIKYKPKLQKNEKRILNLRV